MFSPAVRLILVLFCLVFGVSILIKGDQRGFLPLLAAALFGYGYWHYGTVWLALRALRKGDISRAERLIDKVNDPGKLGAVSRAYYDMCKGVVALGRDDLEAAGKFLESAASGKLRTSNDRSLVAWYRARIALEKGDRTAAAEFLEQARREPHKEEIDKLIADVEKQTG